jgi:hypothetical protein
MRATWLVLPALALCAACLRQTEFKCATNDQCGPNGTCEGVGYCSFPDSECGHRFGDSAGPYANKCVGAAGDDAGIDAPTGTDGPAATCPANYMTLTGGNPGHVYRRAPNNLNWVQQFDFCASTSTRAYLAVPDDITELASLHTLAGGTGTFWIGINDRVQEDTFVLASGDPFTFKPWAGGEPDDPGGGGGQDCVAATATNFSTEDCTGGGANRPAVCECKP